MMGTPVGTFAGFESLTLGRPDATHFALRVSSRKLEGADREHSYGVSAFSRGTSRFRTGATVGWTQGTSGTASVGGGIFQFGIELAGAIWESGGDASPALSVGWKGTGGVGHLSGIPEGNVWSIVGQLPVAIRVGLPNQSNWAAFVSPGLGIGATGDTGAVEEEMGTQPIISAGGAWTSAGGFGVHVGAVRIPADLGAFGDSPWVVGVSLSFARGGTQ